MNDLRHFAKGTSVGELGARSGGEEGRKLLEDEVTAYRSALEVRSKADLPQDWAQTQNNLGNALGELGARSGGEEGRKLLEDAVAAYRSALEVRTSVSRLIPKSRASWAFLSPSLIRRRSSVISISDSDFLRPR